LKARLRIEKTPIIIEAEGSPDECVEFFIKLIAELTKQIEIAKTIAKERMAEMVR